MSDKMMRDNKSKIELSYMLDFPYAMGDLCAVMMFGADKYERNNWKKGGSIVQMENSLLRHVMAFHNGQDYDDESGIHHLAHAMFNAAGIIEHQASGNVEDDRYASIKAESFLDGV